jgi:hypothetical protein
MWLITFIERKLLNLGSGRGEEGKKRRALFALLRDLDRRGPPWYRPWTNRIDPRLGKAALALRDSLVPLGEVFKSSVAGGKDEEAQAIDAVLERVLSAAGISIEQLSFESVRKEAEGAGAELGETMDGIFKKRLEVFSSNAMTRISQGCREVSRLVALWEFDFPSLLRPLGSSGGDSTAFAACEAIRAVEPLADLHFLLDGLSLGPEAAEVYSILCEKTGLGGIDPDSDISAVGSIISRHFPPDRLAMILRSIRGDAFMDLKSFDAKCPVKDDRQKEIIDDYTEKRRLLAENLRAADLDRRKRALFGERDLAEVHGFTDSLSALFIENGLPSLVLAPALAIVKSFMQSYFVPVLRGVLSEALVDIDFADDDFHRELVLAMDRAASVSAALEALEDELLSPSRSKLAPIILSLEKGFLDVAERRAAVNGIEYVEAKGDGIVQAAFAGFAGLGRALVKLLLDLRSKKPSLVANAVFVNRNRTELIARIESSARLLSDCLKLLRLYALDRNEVEKTLAKKD